jgi:hypothetical protein
MKKWIVTIEAEMRISAVDEDEAAAEVISDFEFASDSGGLKRCFVREIREDVSTKTH